MTDLELFNVLTYDTIKTTAISDIPDVFTNIGTLDSGDNEAKYKLAELMLSNLYLIPHLIDQDVQKYDIWHSSNYEYIDYVEYIPEEVKNNIKQSEIQWMNTLYHSFEFRRIRKRYIEIYDELQHTKDLDERKSLLKESYSLLDTLH